MKQISKKKYVKRTQKAYSTSLIMQVVLKVEIGEQSIRGDQRMFGIQGNGAVSIWLRFKIVCCDSKYVKE